MISLLALTLMAQAEVTVIQNATIHTVTNGSIPNGKIVFQNGKIVAVGDKVLTPPGAKVVDAGGGHVMPGIIDTHTHIGAGGTAGINEGSVAVSSMVTVRDIVDPEDKHIYWALSGGVTTMHILHGSANPIGGQNAVVKLRWGKPNAEDMMFEGAFPTLKFALGENPKRSGSTLSALSAQRYPATRMGVEDVIREALTEAKAYQKAWTEFRAGRAPEPRRDLKLDPLVEVLEGKRIVVCHAYRADEMLMMIRVADEFGFKLSSFEHVQEGYKVAKEMAKHGVAGAGFSDWWAYKMEVIDGIPYNMAIMTKKGVLTVVNSDSGDGALMRRLNTEAAKTMKYGGLTEQEALKLITINAAKQLKLESRVGSLEEGKDADIVIWNKHPLSSYAVAQKVFIDGTLYFDRDADIQRRAVDAARKKALEDKLRQQPPAMKKGGPPPSKKVSAASEEDAQ